MTEHLALAQDGTLWAAYTGGLVAFDGETWRVVPFDGDTIDPWGVSVGLDGAAYLALHGSAGNLGGGVGIHRWDGHAWTERGSLFWPGDPVFGRFRIDADGIVWLGVLDVSSDPPRHLELPGQLTGAGSRYTSNFAPGANGNLWVTVHEQRDEAEDVSRGLFVITPEAMASGA